ncbi:MAG TPA: hypothetical protein VLV56_16835 [Burkholderiales bacterium]|nr:hypothetical protein [Burkholderiales bacterium]
MSINPRLAAFEALLKSIRTGEHSAAVALERHLADAVVLEANGPMPGAPTDKLSGRADVLRRLSGNWAVTMALRHARWSAPALENGTARANVTFEHLGGVVPAALAVAVGFDGDRISRVELRYTPRQAQPVDKIPPGARPLINNARINETPILVAHTDESGNPVLTFRGSIQVWSDTALCAWIRQAAGGLVRSTAKNHMVQLAYRDGPRAMLLMTGFARIETDDAIRNRVFEMIPEVEQNHDPARKGAAMIIELTRMQGFTTGGEPVRMERKI